jgi:hypothetical protein
MIPEHTYEALKDVSAADMIKILRSSHGSIRQAEHNIVVTALLTVLCVRLGITGETMGDLFDPYRKAEN